MSNLSAGIGTQVGDAVRPQQTQRDARHQAETAQRAEAADQAPGAEGGEVRVDEVRSAAAELKQVIEAASGRTLNFDVFEDTDDLFVQVKDTVTDELIKEIPSKEMLALRARIQEVVGMLFEGRA